MKSRPTRLDAERSIRDLVARYSDAVNRRDEPAWRATWATSSEWHLLGATKTGRDDIVAHWLDLMATLPFVLQFPVFGLVDFPDAPDAPDEPHDVRSTASITSATGRWYVQEVSQRPERAGLSFGVYHDHYVVEDGRWRFARRRFDSLYRGLPDLSGPVFSFPSDALVASNDAPDP